MITAHVSRHVIGCHKHSPYCTKGRLDKALCGAEAFCPHGSCAPRTCSTTGEQRERPRRQYTNWEDGSDRGQCPLALSRGHDTAALTIGFARGVGTRSCRWEAGQLGCVRWAARQGKSCCSIVMLLAHCVSEQRQCAMRVNSCVDGTNNYPHNCAYESACSDLTIAGAAVLVICPGGP
jgi:hypothetical protein